MGGPTIDRANSSDDIWTPQIFIDSVVRKFGPLAVDLAAEAHSRKAPEYIGPEVDSLKQDWTRILDGRLGWDNPPFGNITPWAKKHSYEWQQGAKTLFLVPGSIGANWFQFYVWPHADVYSVGRMVFDNCFDRKTGLLVTTPYAKDLILCHYGVGTGYKLIFWKDWKK